MMRLVLVLLGLVGMGLLANTWVEAGDVDIALENQHLPVPLDEQPLSFRKEGFGSEREVAELDALRKAQLRIQVHFRQHLEPPIYQRPSVEQIRETMLVSSVPLGELATTSKDRGVLVDSDAAPYTVQLEFELTPDHIRQYRALDRMMRLGLYLGGIVVLCGALWLFARVDQWTGGYLPRWVGLGLGAVLLAALLMVVLAPL